MEIKYCDRGTTYIAHICKRDVFVMHFDYSWHHDAASVSYTHLRAHETVLDLVCRLLLEKKK